MILIFPNLDALRFSLTGAIVPPAVSLAPALVSTDETGRIFVETDGKLSKANRTELERLRVLGSNRHAGETETVASWLQILPMVREPIPATSSAITVLFELSSPAMLPTVVGEMLRLGNDRQSFRLLDEGDDSRALLRVVGPPYYTLLRAIDRLATAGGTVRAYSEASPRVWVELGYSHPFARQIQPDDGQMLLIRSPRTWQYVPDDEFRDVYEILNFTLPNRASQWTEAEAGERITVPIKLVPGNAADAAEMWVVRRDGLDRLDALVRDADGRLTEQLRFAVGTSPAGERSVILGVAPSKKSLPIVELDGAVAFKSYWRIPNLFLPVGTRLHPTIRRDVVTKLLAEDRDRRVWLFPGENGSFVPESISENAFRPLSDWVEYVIDANATDLREWIASTEFDFESYVCSETGPKPKSDRDKSERDKKGKDEKDPPLPKPAATKGGGRKASPTAVQPFEPVAVATKPPSEWQIVCDDLERQFRELDGPLDMPERLALWPRLAEANAGIGEDRRSEAAVCWLNGLWEKSEPAIDLVDGWARSETPNPKLSETELDLRMAVKAPTPAQARSVVSLFLAASLRRPVSDGLRSRLPAIQTYLQKNEERLPIRAVWLAAVRLAQLNGADVLGLARVRDRLLNRLLEKGLSAEQDMPAFLRFAGAKNSERMRVVRERMVEIHGAARAWAEASLKPGVSNPSQPDSSCTLAYLDLLFAFGLAKLGESTPARALVETARESLAAPKPKPEQAIVANYLAKAFKSRVDEALAGKPGAGPTPRELLDELEAIRKKGAKTLNDPHTIAYYVIGRMREQSTILEPREKSDPYSEWMKLEELIQELVALPRIADPAALARRIRELYKTGLKGAATDETRIAVLSHSLRLAPRAGAEFTVELLEHLLAAMKAAHPKSALATLETRKLGRLFESALFLAAHFDRRELLQELVDGVFAVALAKPDDQRYELVNYFAGRCLASLRKVGLRDEIDRLLLRFQDEILKGHTLDQLKALHGAKPDLWAESLQTMLNLSSGWLSFGLMDQAAPILETARAEIHGGARFAVQPFTRLCRAYASALGQSPADFGMPRIAELFTIVDPAKVTNTFTSAPYYSRLHLNLIEDVVLAIVSDDFSLGHAGQRWLDEDEHLVRRRIHRDLRELIRDTGV